jgi:hypothetical protein
MKKQECNHCQNNPGHRCLVCGSDNKDSNNMGIQSNLYAAEFMLYAFHFEDHSADAGSRSTNANPLMMSVARG